MVPPKHGWVFVFSKIGVRRSVRSLALMAVVTGSMAALAPTAQAAPTQTQFTSPVIGLFLSQDGYAGETLLVASTLTAVTDPAKPGVTRFTEAGPFHCACNVFWVNETTGARGEWNMADVKGFISYQTGSGKISATASVSDRGGPLKISPTFVTGVGSWIVP